MRFASAEHCREEVAALTRRNLSDFARRGSLDFWSSRAVYRREAAGRNELLTARQIETVGWGDCEDWTAFFCAWLLSRGGVAVPDCYLSAPGLLHVVALVKTPRGTWTRLDPSALKGMG